jgi:hypothetical protein
MQITSVRKHAPLTWQGAVVDCRHWRRAAVAMTDARPQAQPLRHSCARLHSVQVGLCAGPCIAVCAQSRATYLAGLLPHALAGGARGLRRRAGRLLQPLGGRARPAAQAARHTRGPRAAAHALKSSLAEVPWPAGWSRQDWEGFRLRHAHGRGAPGQHVLALPLQLLHTLLQFRVAAPHAVQVSAARSERGRGCACGANLRRQRGPTSQPRS